MLRAGLTIDITPVVVRGRCNRSNPHSHGINNVRLIPENGAPGGGVGGGGAYGPFANPSDAFNIASTDINHEHGFDFYTDYVYGEVDVNLTHSHAFGGSASVSVSGSCSVNVSVSTTISGQSNT